MKKLLSVNSYTPQWFEKFNLYSENIKGYGRIVLEFKKVDTKLSFDKLLTYGTLINCCISAFFIFELILVG